MRKKTCMKERKNERKTKLKMKELKKCIIKYKKRK